MRRIFGSLISVKSIGGVLAVVALPGMVMAKKKPPTNPQQQQQQQQPAPMPTPTTQPSDSGAKQAAVTSAKQDLKTATAALNAVVQKATGEFQGSDAYVTANKDLTAAKRAYDAASAPALERLHSSAEYIQATAQYKSAHDQIEALRSGGGDPPQDQVSALAQQELASGAKARSLEADALLTDDGVVQAKAKMATAQAAIATLRDQFQKTMTTTAEYTSAKQAVDEATKKLQAAQAMASAG